MILNSVPPLLPLSTFPLGENIRITCLRGFGQRTCLEEQKVQRIKVSDVFRHES